MPKPLKPIPGEAEYAAEYQEDAGEGAVEDPQTSAMRAFFPTSFGKQSVIRDLDRELEQTRRQPKASVSKPPPPSPPSDGGEDGEDSSSDSDDEEFPTSHELSIPTHARPLTSIALDPAGTRFATTSQDSTVHLFDFHGMSTDHLHPFRSFTPPGGDGSRHVHSAEFSKLDSGQRMLIIPASSQPVITDRDGGGAVEFAKGDMYLRDMNNTKGHVSEVSSGTWSPGDAGVVVTAGTDSTVRIWDVERARRGQREVIVHKSPRGSGKGGRSRCCVVVWGGGAQGSSGGSGGMIGMMALDGSLSFWNGNGQYSRPALQVPQAHTPDLWNGGLSISSDGRLVVTRGGDDTIKLWDMRKLKSPITSRTSFPSPPHQQYPESNIIFSPSGTNILTGDADGNLHILSSATLSTATLLPITPGSPLITTTYHHKINHILTGSASGTLQVLYSPKSSTRGARQIVARAPRKRHIDDDPSLTTDPTAISGDAVVLPNAVLGRRPPHAGASGDVRRPAMPASTPWGKSQPDQGHINRSIALSSMRDEDPREALLKYADVAEREPVFTAAWRNTQPVTIYADVDAEEEGEEEGEDKRGGKRVKR